MSRLGHDESLILPVRTRAEYRAYLQQQNVVQVSGEDSEVSTLDTGRENQAARTDTIAAQIDDRNDLLETLLVGIEIFRGNQLSESIYFPASSTSSPASPTSSPASPTSSPASPRHIPLSPVRPQQSGSQPGGTPQFNRMGDPRAQTGRNSHNPVLVHASTPHRQFPTTSPQSPTIQSSADNRNTTANVENDFFKCSICLEICLNKDPTAAPCGHVFCGLCLQLLSRLTRTYSLPQCPNCNKIITKLLRLYP